MTQEEKELLVKDICGRLPYGLKVLKNKDSYKIRGVKDDCVIIRERAVYGVKEFITKIETIKPYLRPMDSMTEEEATEFESISEELLEHGTSEEIWDTVVDWLNAHHFDHRHLIEKGLAIEAPEGMYE